MFTPVIGNAVEKFKNLPVARTVVVSVKAL